MEATSAAQGGRELPAEGQQEDRSFESFFSAESGALYRRLVLILRDRGEAEDVMQEAFIRVWERWDRVQGMTDPVGYLYRVSFRRSVQRRRAAARRALRFPRATRSDESDLADARMDAWLLLGRLTVRQRAALVLTDLIGYSSDEAARILGVRSGTVRMLASQGRAALRQLTGVPDA